jgi:hypothetical protein
VKHAQKGESSNKLVDQKAAGDSTKHMYVRVIEESKRNGGMLNGSVPGMLLSDSFEPDLSHTSILYYRTHRAKLNPH